MSHLYTLKAYHDAVDAVYDQPFFEETGSLIDMCMWILFGPIDHDDCCIDWNVFHNGRRVPLTYDQADAIWDDYWVSMTAEYGPFVLPR
jgi:hypothetical protein